MALDHHNSDPAMDEVLQNGNYVRKDFKAQRSGPTLLCVTQGYEQGVWLISDFLTVFIEACIHFRQLSVCCK